VELKEKKVYVSVKNIGFDCLLFRSLLEHMELVLYHFWNGMDWMV